METTIITFLQFYTYRLTTSLTQLSKVYRFLTRCASFDGSSAPVPLRKRLDVTRVWAAAAQTLVTSKRCVPHSGMINLHIALIKKKNNLVNRKLYRTEHA